MFDYTLLNLGSLLCGLAGWMVPCLGVRKGQGRRLAAPSVVSLTLCGLALWMQIWYQQHLVDIGDWSALMDTAGGVTKISAFLLLTTVLLNLIVLASDKGGKQRREES